MTQKERLVELLRKEYGSDVWLGATKCGVYSAQTIIMDIEPVADYLLQNGVIVPPCRVGDEVYCIKPWKLLLDRIQKEKVYRIDYEESKGCTVLADKGVYYEGEYFHTKAEAEQALKERDSNG